VDLCPNCLFHFVWPLKDWEIARQLEVSGARHEFRLSPTPEKAMALHAQLSAYGKFDEAEQFEDALSTQYWGSAHVSAYLGDVLMSKGKEDQALIAYKRALKLRPDLPEARVAIAFDSMQNGRLGEARFHLSFLEQPGAEHLYSMEPLHVLAGALEHEERHEEALEVFSTLLRAFPRAGQDRAVRRRIRRLEKATGKKVTILPRKRFWPRDETFEEAMKTQRRLTLVVAMLLLVLLLAGKYTGKHSSSSLLSRFTESAATHKAP
jgi:tetratricopeptide (TPR) repeat protein